MIKLLDILNEIIIKPNPKTWDLTPNNWSNLSEETFDQIKIGDYIQLEQQEQKLKYIVVNKEYDDFIDDDMLLYTDIGFEYDKEGYRFLSKNWFNQYDENLYEITIKHNNITVDEFMDYYHDYIFTNDIFNDGEINGAWDKFKKIRNPYLKKTNVSNMVICFNLLSQQDRNKFYYEMKQLVKQYETN